ncbi:IS3 family transposase [Streptomyces sp. NPDC046900]|uniref:IS3 family transposase n=1 Tax=Streptomyces sp. NPDC046900 TaxID=3155473 RepID=UPI0033FCB871
MALDRNVHHRLAAGPPAPGPHLTAVRHPDDTGKDSTAPHHPRARGTRRPAASRDGQSRHGTGHIGQPAAHNAAVSPRKNRGQRLFSTVRQARLEIFQWLTYYNVRRRHSALNYLSPVEFEQQHLRADKLSIAA